MLTTTLHAACAILDASYAADAKRLGDHAHSHGTAAWRDDVQRCNELAMELRDPYATPELAEAENANSGNKLCRMIDRVYSELHQNQAPMVEISEAGCRWIVEMGREFVKAIELAWVPEKSLEMQVVQMTILQATMALRKREEPSEYALEPAEA